jgi:hypothetical protein
MARARYVANYDCCAYCRVAGPYLCDWSAADGTKCGKPMCWRHRAQDGGQDLCREHAPAVETDRELF